MDAFRQALKTEQQDDTTQTADTLASLNPKKLEQKGLAVLNLTLGSVRSSLGGRTIFSFGPDKALAAELVACVKVGDIVGVHTQKSLEKHGEGVVTKTGPEIDVAFEQDVEVPDSRVCLFKLVNTATYTRMHWALDALGDSARLHKLVQGEHAPQIEQQDCAIYDTSLNGSQIGAAKYALGSDLAIIHGPPGTGKTSTVVEIARQLVARGERVLLCGPSNVSVDNLVERLSPYFKTNQLVRLGHPARVSDAVLKHSLDLVSRTSDAGQIVAELRAEIDAHLKSLKRAKRNTRKEIYSAIRDLRRDLKQREKGVVRELLLGAKIVVATLHTSGSTFLNLVPKPLFNTLIIDEVSQAMLPQSLVPMVVDPHISRLVIAGDNKQLPPTVLSTDLQVKCVLERTLFDVLEERYPSSKHLLDTQYRFPREIMEYPNMAFYDGQLKVLEPVASQRLAHLGYRDDSESTVLWIDTVGQCPEQREEGSLSTFNEGEADLVKAHIDKLVANGLELEDIGVITPYAAQVAAIKQLVPGAEVATVDGFQGREKEAIVMSMVRSNAARDVGFVVDERRINVAITRPRRHLCIVGDIETLAHGALQKWTNWVQDNVDIVYP